MAVGRAIFRIAPARPSPIEGQPLLALFAAKNLDALIDASFTVLDEAVSCDIVSAFFRRAGIGLFKERDSRGREYQPEFMRRFVELTPALPIALANPGIKLITTREALQLSGDRLRRTPFYQEVMKPQGWRHGVALCFWDDPPAEAPVFVVSVYRVQGRRDFSALDLAKLEHAHAFLESALTRVLERESAAMLRVGLGTTAHDAHRGVAILDSNIAVTQVTPTARRLAATWLEAPSRRPSSAPGGRWRLPPDLEDTCRTLQREWERLLRADPDATGIRWHRRVPHARVAGLVASITLVGPASMGLGEPTFVVELTRRTARARRNTPGGPPAILSRMTRAERTVAMALGDGLSNQEVAAALGKTVDAVKFLLHQIYRKTGVPNRTALAAALRSSA